MAKSAKRAKTAGSAKSGRSAGSAKSSRSAKSAKSARSAKSAKSASSRGRSTKSAKSAARTGGSKSAKSSRRGGGGRANAAFMAPVQPSPALADVVGEKPIPRTEVTKRLWAYIKKNGLQDQKNKRMIKADEALRDVFGGKATVNMFEMTKLVNKHLK